MPTLSPTVDLFAALADVTRLRIVNLLIDRRELCVCDLQAVLDAPQSKISRHLAYLRRTGMVAARRVDQWMHYSIPPTSPLRGAMHTAIRTALAADRNLARDLDRLQSLQCKGKCAARPAATRTPVVRAIRIAR